MKARIFAPLATHVAEELWAAIGNKGLVAKAEWPKPNDKLVDRIAEASESVIKDTLEDTSEILKATGLTPRRVTYYVAAPWKWRIYQKALDAAVKSQNDQGNFIRVVIYEPGLSSN